MPPIHPPVATTLLSATFLALGLAVAALGVAYVGLARRRLGHGEAAVRRTLGIGALVAAGWIALWLALAESGLIARFELRPPPFAFMVLAVLVAGVALAKSRVGEWLSTGTPTALLIGFQGFRLPLELAMHRAAGEGVMPVQMSFEGMNFDIVTGIAALVVLGATRGREPPRAVTIGFALLGTALLVIIVTVAVASTPVVRAFGVAPSQLNTFVAFAPFVLLPMVMVLAALAGQLVLFRRIAFLGTRSG